MISPASARGQTAGTGAGEGKEAGELGARGVGMTGEALKRLVKDWADVFVENYGPGVIEAFQSGVTLRHTPVTRTVPGLREPEARLVSLLRRLQKARKAA